MYVTAKFSDLFLTFFTEQRASLNLLGITLVAVLPIQSLLDQSQQKVLKTSPVVMNALVINFKALESIGGSLEVATITTQLLEDTLSSKYLLHKAVGLSLRGRPFIIGFGHGGTEVAAKLLKIKILQHAFQDKVQNILRSFMRVG